MQARTPIINAMRARAPLAAARRLSASIARHLPAAFGRHLLTCALALLALVWAAGAHAQVVRPFTSRFSTNANGDVKLIGNTSMTCSTTGTGGANCLAARAGGNFNNNNFTMVHDNTAGDATTFNATSSNLNIPSTATVLYAGLYWGGNSNSAQRGQVLFKSPGAGGFSTVFAGQVDPGNATAQFASNYSAFADVTSIVKAAGIGYYTVANVQSDSQDQTWGGWGLVVAYQDSAQPLRNLVIYDGYSLIANASGAVSLTPSGFVTPLSGPIVTRIGSLGWDGDLASTGDNLAVNGTSLVDALNQTNNYFNSSLSDLGVLATANVPSYANQLGVDVDRSNVPAGVIANGATSATITATSTGETYYLAVVTFSTDIYVPIITPNLSKTVTDVNGGYLLPGDTLRWTISMNNTGQDAGTKLTLTDPIPANNTYVPGSLRVVSGANAGTKTDAAGDDQAEKVAAPNQVVFRLGTGASASQGGTLAYTQATSVSFDTIVGSVPAGTQITNTASITYSGQTLATTTFSSSSTAANLTVTGPPTIAKSFTPASIAVGGTAQLKIVIATPAANPGTANGVTFSDVYPAGVTNAATPNPQVVCTAGATAGTLTGAAAGGNNIGMNPGATIPPNGSCTITVNVTGVTGTYTNTTSAVSSTNAGTGGTASATLAVGELAIVKSFSPATINAGATSQITFQVNNGTGAAQTGLAFTDTLTSMQLANGTVTGTCTGVTSNAAAGVTNFAVTAGSVPAGGCTVIVNVTSSTAGILPNTTSGVNYTGGGAAGPPSNTANLTVVAAPTITKSFTPTVIASGGSSTLTLVISNPNTTVTVTRAGTVFSDAFPAAPGAMTNVNPRNVSLSCSSANSSATMVGGAAGGNSIGISALTLLPGESCTLTTVVTAATNGTYSNNVPVGSVTYDNAPSAASNTATLTVSTKAAPTPTKTFTPASIALGGTSTMAIAIANGGGLAINGVNFTDTYPAGLFNSATPAPTASAGCGGTPVVTAAAGGASLSLSGVNIAAGATCTVSVQVTSSAAGTLVNSTGSINSSDAPTGTAVTGILNVQSPPTIDKAFGTSPVALNTASVMTITLTNPSTNSVALTGVGFTDTYPAGLVNTNATIGGTCTGTRTATAGGNSLTASAVPLAIGASCTITISVQSATAGNYVNTTGAVTSTNAGTGGTATATLAVGKLGIVKSFTPASIAAGGSSVITFQITNGTGAARTGLAFTDTLTNMQVLNGAVGGTCTGVTSNAAAGVTAFAVTAGSVPAGGCTITINVTSSTPGVQPNTTSGATHSADATPSAPSNTANLTVTPPPSVTKSFSPAQVAAYVSPAAETLGTNVATLTFTLFNTTATAATGASFNDSYPSGLVNAATPGVTNTCGGTVTAAAGSASLSLSGGTVPVNSNCIITVQVRSSTPGAYTNTFPAGALSTSLGANASASSDTLTVMQPVVPAKSFSPGSIASGATALLTITLSNPNGVAVTGVGFTDTYPAGLTNATPANAATSCGGGAVSTPATNQLQLAGATVPAGGSCTVSVNVTGANGSYVNTLAVGAVTSGNAGASTVATSDNLQIGRPRLDKAFSPNPILPGGISTLTFTVTNPSASAATAVQFTDTFPTVPGAMVVAAAPSVVNNCGGTFTAAAGAASVSLTGGTVAASSSCTISVRITAPTSGTVANPTYNNVTTGFSANATAGTNASATLTVMAAPTVAKAFSPTVVGIGQVSVLTVTLSNPNNFAVTGAAFTDTYPANLANSATPAGSTTCTGGTVTAANGGTQLALSGGIIPAGGSCTVSVNVAASAAGTLNNSIAAGGLTSTNAPASAAAASAALTVLSPLAVTKSFNPTSKSPAGGAVTMTITLTNPNTVTVTGVNFTDTYPAGLTNAAAANATESCPVGVVSAANSGNSVSFFGGTVAASSSCAITVQVTASTIGAYTNNTGVVATDNAGNAPSAGATLTVNAPLVINKSFNAASVTNGTPSLLTLSLSNPNAATITGITFTDAYPNNLRNLNGTVLSNTCGGTASASAAATNPGTLTLTAGSLAGNTSCAITINVVSTTNAIYTNCTTAFTPTNAGASAVACGTLAVGNAANSPPTITKAFAPAQVNPNGASTMTLTITNTSTNGASALAVTDTYPAGLINATPLVASTTCTGGTLTAAAGGASVALSGGTLAAGANCTVTVSVTSATAGIYNNTTGTVTATINGATRTGGTASAALVVNNAATIAKAFSPTTITSGGTSTITFTLTNPNATALSAAAFTDALSGMSIAAPGGAAGGTCTNANANSFTTGTTSLSFTNLGIPGNGTCTVTVVVTSSTPGTLLNATSGVTVGGGTGPVSNTASLTVNALAPTIAKAFSPTTIASGANTTMTLTLSNPNGAPLTGISFTDGMTNMNLAAIPNLGGTCTGVTSPSTGGASSFTVTGGTIPANASCTITVQVTSTTAGTWPNATSGVSSNEAPTPGSQSNTANLTVLPSGVGVSGTVFNDANTNGTLDGGETWAAGTPVFVNLISGGVVQQSVAVAAGTGNYSFASVPTGNYTLIIAASNTATTAAAPSGWFFTGPTDGTINTAVGIGGLTGLNFGLRSGPRITGRVFRDVGTVPAGTAANNGVLDSGEAPANPQTAFTQPLGISGVTLTLTNCGATIYGTTTTDASGAYSFATPGGLSAGNPLCVLETTPNGYLSTGASVGTTAIVSNNASVTAVSGVNYSYCRTGTCTQPAGAVAPADGLRFTYAAGATYIDLNFGDVPVNTFVADQTQQGPAGTTINYAHTFVPGSVGTVTFTSARVATPAAPVWNEVIYRDANCNAVLDGTEGSATIDNTPIAVDPNSTTAGDPSGRRVCIIVREFIPASAAVGAVNKATISAAFTYANANPALAGTLTVIDTTLSGSATGGDGLRLRKEVCNVTTTVAPGCVAALTGANAGNGFADNNAGKPGDELVYRIIYSNASSNNLTSLVVNDATPPFTVRSTLTAPAYAVTPAGLTNGSITAPAAGATGGFNWTFTGNLTPNAQGVVTFNVQIQ